jgi:ATP-dependent RNA helicase DDX51/DBP6
MSQFYARYVPPTKDVSSTAQSSPRPEKRKLEQKPAAQDKPKKRQKQHEHGAISRGQVAVARQLAQQGNGDTKKLHASDETLQERNVTTTHDEGLDGTRAENRDSGAAHHNATSETPNDAVKGRKSKRLKEKKTSSNDVVQQDPGHDDEDYAKRHGSVLTKFNKALAERTTAARIEDLEQHNPSQQVHGLEPIPQPKVVDLPKSKPNFSTLTPWQAKPIQVVHKQKRSFSDLNIAKTTVENLSKNGLSETFPIQTTVLPLLLSGPDQHEGDVCVSAATGSGKTLAYVLPIVEDLKTHSSTKLRAVIVVPTRELVQQVRQLCELCAAGAKLKIVTASGNKSLKEEQSLLVTEEDVYDAQLWQKQRQAPVDWDSFDMTTFVQEAKRRQRPSSLYFRREHRSLADILITTPGRLVDHLQSTPGFNLDHVSWLVVDEADRLLNESYQEWVDVVTPALSSRAATAERDNVLERVKLTPPPRHVRKVLLSATMTKDISKLNSLGLKNPKLVVLGHAPADYRTEHMDVDTQEGAAEDNDAFHIPLSLSEFVVQIKDGYEKPLHLLELLQTRLLGATSPASTSNKPAIGAIETDSSESDSDKSSDTSSSTDSDSDSDPDSDSDSDSDSSSNSSSSSDSSTSTTSTSNAIRNRPNPETSTSSNHLTTQPLILIFIRSTSATTRLSRLLTFLSPSLGPKLSTLTKSTSSSASSRRALSAFRSGRTPILLATDRASRGLDIPDLAHVVSYDVPSSALTYIHRVGRTARAGKRGSAWTLVEHREGRWFWREIGGKNLGGGEEAGVSEGGIWREGKVGKVVLEVDVEGWKGRYDEALKRLGEEVRGG